MTEKTDWKTPVIVVVAVIVVAIIVFAVIPKKVGLEPLTDEDFKILSVDWNQYAMEYDSEGMEIVPKIPKQPIDWEEKCNYCLTGMVGTSDMFKDVDKEIRCRSFEANLLIQSSKNLSGNFIINGVKLTELGGSEIGGYYPNGIYLRDIPDGLAIDKTYEIVFCAINSDLHWIEQEPVCKSVTLPAKCQ